MHHFIQAAGINLNLSSLFSGDSIMSHWRSLVAIWVAICAINTMPSPSTSGPTSSWLYKWLFALTHMISAGIPRILATLFPTLWAMISGVFTPPVSVINPVMTKAETISTTLTPSTPTPSTPSTPSNDLTK